MILPFKRYFDFKGRSRRKEFWMYTLFVFLVSIVLTIVDGMLGLGGSATGDADLTDTSAGAAAAFSGGWLTNIFALATLIPSIAVSVRRLHDLDRTGWWILLPLAPYLLGIVLMIGGMAQAMNGGGIGGMAGIAMLLFGVTLITAILLLVWYCMPGTAGPNRFGEDPKSQGTNAEEVFG
ncbi:DUF805 domain-containing protein [Sphingomonas sp. MS122]|uniref:DUF805 domain-containing protein n=1 Tax=Sphingomonas sp. MS122 TaxID=3412683 RepID=UPI003C2AD099